ncbi:hypothetical protein I6F20_17050 [Bradyrhizobium sp. IC3123]|uniref:hypothetical protein n=1 Tax=Bradyrhizobium sp. IC3123 TaxID=2793803 RepID=UPI001CD73FD5|nr:hypothetical protein [Bradyrhizobium sp. IC3123]MCA1390776.1 hypothetical protein [Bradyrhizobium sp. IC3123]
MAERDREMARALASDIMARATIHRLHADADELAEAARVILAPLPALDPLDPLEREEVLAKDMAARRLLVLVVDSEAG